MKRLTVLETSIIGFFIGVVVAAYTTFLISNGGFVGHALHWISLRPLLVQFHIPENQVLITSFAFFVTVFTLYGAIVGLIIKKLTRAAYVIIPIILLVGGLIFAEQNAGSKKHVIVDDVFAHTATVLQATNKTPKQYFGTEARGDLDGDGKEDVAFIINRNDDSRGMLYYLAAALNGETGYTGTNLIFLGDEVVPKNIYITDNIITIEYSITATKELEIIQAHVTGGVLQRIDKESM